MNKLKIALAGSLIAPALLLASCGGASESTESSVPAVSTAEKGEISSFAVRENIKSVSRSYRMVGETDTCWLKVSTTVQWPEQIGDADIASLQDTIMATAYRTYRANDIDASMLNYVADTELYELGTAERIDSVPSKAGEKSYYASVTSRLLELNTNMVTCQVSMSSFMGGAHPNSMSVPFTYDLKNGTVLNLGNMFREGTKAEVTDIVRTTLAEQFGVKPSTLVAAGFFTNDVALSDLVYVANGMVTFHYNAYDIAPYSMGAIDVKVAPWLLEEFLTPQAAALLLK